MPSKNSGEPFELKGFDFDFIAFILQGGDVPPL